MGATSKEEIESWFKEGVKDGHAYLIVRCDTFNHEDYPVYADSLKEANKVRDDYSNIQLTHAVYDLKKPMKSQIG